MGLLDHILSNQLYLKLIDDGKGGQEIEPRWYLAVEFDYNAPTRKSRAELREEAVAWLVELAGMFEDIPAQSRYLSGPLGVFTLTNDYPWQETYAELSMFAQKAVLEAHVTAARAHNFYLMRRVSAKLSVWALIALLLPLPFVSGCSEKSVAQNIVNWTPALQGAVATVDTTAALLAPADAKVFAAATAGFDAASKLLEAQAKAAAANQSGSGLRFGSDGPGIQHVKLYRYR